MYLDVEPVEGPGLGHEDPVDPLEDGELGPVPDHDHHLPLGVALVWSLATLLKKISFKKKAIHFVSFNFNLNWQIRCCRHGVECFKVRPLNLAK